MSEINIPRDERGALKAVDTVELNKLIDQCFHEEQPAALQTLRLGSCGPYIASRLREYEKALAEHYKAKAAKKRAETESRARDAGRALEHAVAQMKHRVNTEEKEGLLFYVEDQIMPPHRFSEHMTVRVPYRWRRVIEDEWVHGSITFSHDVDTRPDYTLPISRRKLSAAKQEQDRQDRLYREWEHLKMLGLHSVKDYLREGGNGAAIPQTFRVKPDSYTRGLNNYSAQFEPVRS
jgi:hypothetical protein